MTSSNEIELGKLFMEDGLPGFSQLQFFQLIQEEPETPFLTLRSMEDEEVGFWVVDPFLFFPTYEFTLPEPAKVALRIQEDSPVAVVVIVTLRGNGEFTANLKAPLVINQEKRIAKQVILNEEQYQVRQPLFKPQAAAASE